MSNNKYGIYEVIETDEFNQTVNLQKIATGYKSEEAAEESIRLMFNGYKFSAFARIDEKTKEEVLEEPEDRSLKLYVILPELKFYTASSFTTEDKTFTTEEEF
jgi:hypothetical protein